MNRSRSESTIKGAAAFSAAHGNTKAKPSFTFHQPAKEEKNVLLDDVRERLEKLRESQRKKDLEDKFMQDQRLLSELLLEEEIQNLISKKIKEAVLVEETQSVLTKQSSCQSRGGVRSVGYSRNVVTRGSDRKSHNNMHLAFTMSDAAPRSEDTYPAPSSSHAAHTYPSSASRLHTEDHLETLRSSGSRSGSRPHTPERHLRTETEAGADDNSVNSDLNSIGSVGSLGSVARRPALIVIKKKEINGRKILETVRQKLPSPEKLEGDPQYPTAAFTASLLLKHQLQQQQKELKEQKEQLLREQKEQAQIQLQHAPPAGSGEQQQYATLASLKNNAISGKTVKLAPVAENINNTSSKSDVGEGSGKIAMGGSGKPREGSGRWNLIRPIAQRGGIDVLQSEDSFNTSDFTPSEESTAPAATFKPAPFLKARSSSGILNRGLSDGKMAIPVIPVAIPKAKVVGEIVRGLSVSHLRKEVSRRLRPSIRSSQQFTLQSIDLHLDELQGDSILSTRFGGWTPPPISASSKHTSGSSFY